MNQGTVNTTLKSQVPKDILNQAAKYLDADVITEKVRAGASYARQNPTPIILAVVGIIAVGVAFIYRDKMTSVMRRFT